MWLLILLGIFMCVAVCDLFLMNDKTNPCDTCVYRFCVSNQHPTVCDVCKDGSNYEAESEELDMRFDISNSSERIVKCVEKYDTSPYSCDYELLEIGKKYTVTNVDVFAYHTMITLKEFPGKEFNSVLFAESEDEG